VTWLSLRRPARSNHSAPDVRLSLLVYADDTAILANSAEELQQLLTSVDGLYMAGVALMA
jgi:hypothetical protein